MKCENHIINSGCVHSLIYPGDVSPEHFKYLISLSRVRGKKAINALEAFLVKGWSRKEIFVVYKISPGYFSLKLKQVRKCNLMISEILPFYID